MTTPSREQQLLARIALPSSLGLTYGEKIWGHPWSLDPWIAYMEERIMDAILDTAHERFIIINAPPQVGKTSYVGELLPWWYTGHFPDNQVMYVSYSDEFSHTRGDNVMGYHRVFGPETFGMKINSRVQSKGEWRLAGHRGGMLSVGIGGLITGKPGHLIIIDDLIKNMEDARSTAVKDSHENEWDGTIKTRLQPGGTVILMATRWAEDDLTGRLKARMQEADYDGPAWEILEFPAFAEPPDDVELTPEELASWSDIIGRLEGEVLPCRFSRLPDRAPEDFFERARAGYASNMNAWYCLYQQRPAPTSGSMFPPEDWRYYKPEDQPEFFDRRVRVWDLAATAGGGDFTVGTLMGRKGNRWYVLDVKRVRKSAGGVQEDVLDTAKKDGYGVVILIEEEKGGAGKSLIASYQMNPDFAGYVIEAAKAEGDKTQRAMPWSAVQNRHTAFLPEPGSVGWDVKAFVKEHQKMMPDGRKPRNDDQVDTASYGCMFLLGTGAVEMVTPDQLPVPDSYIDELVDSFVR